jgi:squalene synthase HpnC
VTAALVPDGQPADVVTQPRPAWAELERAENFPVALRMLPRRLRRDLRAAYAVARLIDDVGDDPSATPAERLRRLDVVEADLRTAFAGGAPALDAVRGLLPAIGARRLHLEAFLALVEANRLDQTSTRYPTYDDLRDYCRRSADPVGRIVLALFDVADAEAERLSDCICTALQVLEHCQDVVEDKRDRDRVYLPLEDLARFRVGEADLDGAHWDRATAQRLGRLVGFEVDRAAALLADGAPLVRRLHGSARVAVAGYVAGGLATVDALRRAGHDVVSGTPRPRPADVVRHALALLAGRS